MTPSQLIEFLRNSVSIQDPDSSQDSAYISMTDEEIELYIQVVLTRDYPDVSLEDLPPEYVYPVVLLAKKELYYALAVKDAPLYDLGADNNNYLKRSQRFDHYMKLIAQVDKEYEDYLDNGGAGGNTLTSFDVLLPNRSGTKRNHEKGAIPALTLYVDSETSTSVELSWKVKVSRFESCALYISESPIYDKYGIGDSKISKDAKEVIRIRDSRQTACRITGLTPGTSYFILLTVTDMNNLTGYKETTVRTAEAAEVNVGG